jgi:hypothetical protein
MALHTLKSLRLVDINRTREYLRSWSSPLYRIFGWRVAIHFSVHIFESSVKLQNRVNGRSR